MTLKPSVVSGEAPVVPCEVTVVSCEASVALGEAAVVSCEVTVASCEGPVVSGNAAVACQLIRETASFTMVVWHIALVHSL